MCRHKTIKRVNVLRRKCVIFGFNVVKIFALTNIPVT